MMPVRGRSVTEKGLESGHLPEGIPIYFWPYELEKIDAASILGCGYMYGRHARWVVEWKSVERLGAKSDTYSVSLHRASICGRWSRL